jgi:DNA-binding transcriptional MerR regulator
MKYLTTQEVANEIAVSKQTLLNWLYSGKVPEPPRNKKGYRLWSLSRVAFLKRLIAEGRIHKRTVIHAQDVNQPRELARDVHQFLREQRIDAEAFLDELGRLNAAVGQRLGSRRAAGSGARKDG